jgi:choline dehydrogenase-like flavoprotein
METFDYVIVGGGTAACVLANRLTENGQYSVLMLEAGGEPKSMWINIPAGFTKLSLKIMCGVARSPSRVEKGWAGQA